MASELANDLHVASVLKAMAPELQPGYAQPERLLPLPHLDCCILFFLEQQHAAVYSVKLNLQQAVAPGGSSSRGRIAAAAAHAGGT